MISLDQPSDRGGKVPLGTKSALLSLQELEAMQKRRFQNPTPKIHGKRWTIRVEKLVFVEGAWKTTRPRIGRRVL